MKILFIISFITIAFSYAILSSATTILYKNRSTSELNYIQRNILYGRATFGERFSLFMRTLLSSFIFPFIYIISALVAWFFG